MARRRGNSSSSIYVSTNPQNNVPIGIPGQGTAIGRMGVWIFGRGPGAIDAGGMIMDLSSGLDIDMTHMEIQLE